MAEVVGLVFAGVQLIALIETVNELFQQVQTAKSLGKDYEQLSLELELAQLAFNRWLKCVYVTDDTTKPLPVEYQGWPVVDQSEVHTVERLLGNIQAAFEDAGAKTAPYEAKATAAAAKTSCTTPAFGGQGATATLAERVHERTKLHQKAANIIDKIRWVFKDASAYRALVDTIGKNIKELTTLFPALSKPQIATAQIDLEGIIHETPDDAETLLPKLQNATSQVDPAMEAAMSKNPRSKHLFENNTATDDVAMMNGDWVDVSWGARPRPSGGGSVYRGQKASGKANVFNGDYYGDSKKITRFWNQ